MPSVFTTLSLCFASFILGQLFQVSIHPTKREILVVPSGFSLSTVVSVIVCVLLVHDALALLFLLRPLTSRSSNQKHRFKSLAVAAADTIPEHRLALRLPPVDRPAAPMASGLTFHVPSLFWVRRNLSQSSFKVVRRRPFLLIEYTKASPASIDRSIDTRWMIISAPRPFWRLSGLGPNVARSLVEYKTALAPLIKIRSPLAPHTSRLLDVQDSTSFTRLSETAIIGLDLKKEDGAVDVCSIEEQEEQVEDFALELNTTSLENEARPAQDTTPTPPRASQAPLLRHIAAAALLRRLGFCVVEEPSTASIEEVTDEDEEEKVAQVEEVQNVAEEAPAVVDETKGVMIVDAEEVGISVSSGFGREEQGRVEQTQGGRESRRTGCNRQGYREGGGAGEQLCRRAVGRTWSARRKEGYFARRRPGRPAL
ncbi:hypothetical protein DFH06DRAFT_1155429 [Mycena polygramma]|nr:hypothetical protein DFH06DRAFT_1155429 [Mycena polygramma]